MKEPNSMEDLVLQPYRVGGCQSLSRLVNKTGDKNITSVHVPEKSAKYLNDIVTTLVSYFEIFARSGIEFMCRRWKLNGAGC